MTGYQPAAREALRPGKRRWEAGDKRAGVRRRLRTSLLYGSRLSLSLLVLGMQTIPAAAQLAPPKQYTVSPTGVNMNDTTYTQSITDLTIGPLTLERSYLGGLEVSNHYFGPNWSHNFDIWAYTGTYSGQDQVKVVIGRKTYAYWGTLTQNEPQTDEYGTSVELRDGVISFTDRDGLIYRFNSATNGKIASISAPDGSVSTFSYVSGKLKTISSNRGYAIVFEYGSNGAISSACGYNRASTFVNNASSCSGAAIRTSYDYSSVNGVAQLWHATTVTGQTATYTYDPGNGMLACETDPGVSACRLTNGYRAGTWQVAEQVLGDGQRWQFDCTCSFMGRGEDVDSFPQDSSGWTDPSGSTVGFGFTNFSPDTYIDQNGRRWGLGFDGGTFVSVLPPDGNRSTINYNDRMVFAGYTFKAKNGSTPDIQQDTQSFPDTCSNRVTCNKPLSTTDSNGNATLFEYDQIHGGVLRETSPAVDGVSAVVRHRYVQRSAWVKTPTGGFVAESPIWVISEDRTCKSSATVNDACSDGSADEVVTSYDYGPDAGPNTLVLRGKLVSSDGVSYRTCYGYDLQGNRISQTSPRANLAACA